MFNKIAAIKKRVAVFCLAKNLIAHNTMHYQ